MPIEKEDLQRLYHDEKLSLNAVAKKLGYSLTNVYHHMRKYGIEVRSRSEAVSLRFQDPVERQKQARQGEESGGYKHGLYVQEKAYRTMIAKEICSRCGAKDRLVIHHINHDHRDNRVDNLEVMCRACHLQHHIQAHQQRRKANRKS